MRKKKDNEHHFATFFEKGNILRSMDLPVNYKFIDIARHYLSEKYTTDEIIFNNLDKQVVDAITKLKTDIDKVASTMKIMASRLKKWKHSSSINSSSKQNNEVLFLHRRKWRSWVN